MGLSPVMVVVVVHMELVLAEREMAAHQAR